MKKVFSVILTVVLLSGLILSGCGQPAPAPAPAPLPAPAPTPAPVPPPAPAPAAWKWPDALTLQPLVKGGPTFVSTAAWAPILENKSGMNVRQTVEGIHPIAMKNVLSDKYDIFCNTFGTVGMAVEGAGSYATRDLGPFQMRLLWPFQMTSFATFVRGDSHIKTWDDVKPGVKISVHPGAGPRTGPLAVIAWAGLTEEEADIVVFGNVPATNAAVVEGKVDMKWSTTMSPAMWEAEGNPHGIRWLEMDPKKDPEAAKRFSEVKPLVSFGKPAAGSVPSVQGMTVAIDPFCYWTTEETIDTELAYHLAKFLDENYDEYEPAYNAAPDMRIERFREFLDTTPLPVHSGVIKYLKEKGMWSATDDKRQAYNVGLITKYVNAYKAAIAEADAKGEEVHPDNKTWMGIWANQKKVLPKVKIMYEIP